MLIPQKLIPNFLRAGHLLLLWTMVMTSLFPPPPVRFSKKQEEVTFAGEGFRPVQIAAVVLAWGA